MSTYKWVHPQNLLRKNTVVDSLKHLKNIDMNRIKEFITKIENIRNYNINIYLIVKHIIIDCLFKAETDKYFKNILYIIIDDATQTCEDRLILSCIYAQIQYQISEYTDSISDNIINIYHLLINGVLVIDLIHKYININHLETKDDIELFLGYIIRLKKKLNIPISINNMLYFQHSKLTSKNLEDIECFINIKINNSDELNNFLIHQDIWVNILKSQYSTKIKNIYDERDKDVETINVEDSEQILHKFNQKLTHISKEFLRKLNI